MKRLLGLCLALLTITAAAQGDTPRYESRECPIIIQRLAHDSAADIRCGYLIVLEAGGAADRARQLELFVLRIAARQPAGNAPLIFLTGGPGSPVTARVPDILASRLSQHYDIIAIDQRGAGFSQPSLNCPEADDPKRESKAGWIRECKRRLVDEGIALEPFNSAKNAKDIHDLLVALEIKEASVYGESYGSRLALTLARDFPQRARALILDGLLPIHVNQLEAQALNGYRALEQLFADCGSDGACNQAYPNLREGFFSVLRRLNREPARRNQADLQYPIVTTGDDFVAEILAMLGVQRLIPYVPAFIDAFRTGTDGKDPLWEALAQEARAAYKLKEFATLDDLSEGLWLTVRCAEAAPFNSRDEIVNQAAKLPGAVRRGLVNGAMASLSECKWWDAPRAPDRENQPVRSDIPALLLSGRYDPITPPAWGDEAAEYLVNSWHYVFSDSGHGVLFDSAEDCAESIALSFLAEPRRQPTEDCLAALSPPDFLKLDA